MLPHRALMRKPWGEAGSNKTRASGVNGGKARFEWRRTRGGSAVFSVPGHWQYTHARAFCYARAAIITTLIQLKEPG